MSIDGENIENTLANHVRLPKQGGQTTIGKFDRWLKGRVSGRLPKGYELQAPIPPTRLALPRASESRPSMHAIYFHYGHRP
ncbi:MAG: hypothetical protein L0226_11710 [Acidobacteria bacterium]|nr:hypothetical protein [Acidobacteriota bacterium]